MFHVGQHVVCVDDHFDDTRPLSVIAQEVIPTRGKKYTVRDVGYLDPEEDDVLCVRLEEIVNPEKTYRWSRGTIKMERVFGARRFRPLQDSRLDIFRQLLVNPPKQRVDA